MLNLASFMDLVDQPSLNFFLDPTDWALKAAASKSIAHTIDLLLRRSHVYRLIPYHSSGTAVNAEESAGSTSF